MRTRSLIPELMDDPKLSEDRLQAALKDVTLVNRFLGGQQITIDGIKHFTNKFPQKRYSIVDLGCGDGAMLRKIADFARKNKFDFQLLGLDLNAKSIALAKSKSANYSEIEYFQKNILQLNKDTFSCDIITSTLTMHHFTDVEIQTFLMQFLSISKLGVVINDLQRSRVAYVLFKAFSVVFMKTHIARHDGLISIKRAFTKNELLTFTQKLPLESYKLKWRWAFRYLWILEKQQ
ncbi:methyltransferase family protein [Leeuwenhoekiella aestuarii]|uniref:Methyltransferase family protein n=1 Tax=Leeuwenhoekiella aestuarii TaxID=2249426 RepID=A0A4Q0NSH9_9FLAO|nr:methyltransferase domain-containing protein [Leeuwenhoekiella aestuarii]RXG13414.1 methyltransferase family protein [Leeuwenhoekiella aestuarii]RXG14855.1 methyltransferase family protein [Leeuwenhoekiella aestuarii]